MASHVRKDTIHRLTFYEIFSLDPSLPDLDVSAIHRAYRRFSLLFHPDKDASPAARAAFERVKLAAETLSDASRRMEYDASLRPTRESPMAPNETDWAERAERADVMLRQKEAASLARAAAVRQAEEEKEAAAREMLRELTSALCTPFRQMEATLIHEWDIDEELLRMKEREVEGLLHRLREYEEEPQTRQRDGKRMSAAKRERSHDIAQQE